MPYTPKIDLTPDDIDTRRPIVGAFNGDEQTAEAARQIIRFCQGRWQRTNHRVMWEPLNILELIEYCRPMTIKQIVMNLGATGFLTIEDEVVSLTEAFIFVCAGASPSGS